MAVALGRPVAAGGYIARPATECLVEEPLDILYCVRGMAPRHIDKDIRANYQIDNFEIAAGGFGKVFRASDRKHPERQVAIKSMLLSSRQHQEVSENEVNLMKTLDHPHICKLFETYQKGALMYYVMELCEGKDLFEHMFNTETPRRLEEQKAAEIIQQVVSALQYAHDKGIAHRDIKPENVVFSSQDPDCNQIKVIDWGVGHDFGARKMRHFAGTVKYCAPEVMQADRLSRWFTSYTAACDMWSVGVLIYVMLAGRMPFWGNQKALLQSMKKEQYSMEGQIWESISEDAKTLIRGLLQANPKMRLSPKDVLSHPWITESHRHPVMSEPVANQVLSNMRNFSNLGHFYSICVAAVVRQLGSKHLNEVHRIFCSLDTDGNGVLTSDEVRQGFSAFYPAESQEMRELTLILGRLDKDGSGGIDYNEFCAAAAGERVLLEESSLWAAFHSFDQLQDGKLSLEEIKNVLQSSDVSCVWHQDVLETAATQALQRFDIDGDGAINFDEFRQLMHEHAAAKKMAEAEKLRMGWSPEERSAQLSLDELEAELQRSKAQDAYRVVTQMKDAHCDHFGRGLFRKVTNAFKPKPKAQAMDQARLGNC